MTKSMHALSASAVVEFCKLCDWAHEVWLNHRELFYKNQRATELQESLAGEELARLSIISQEYCLLLISKLHDKAVAHGNENLGIDYVLEYGAWSDSVRDSLKELKGKLDDFASPLLVARNKLLAHNDLATIEDRATLGKFAEGADEEYFNTLQEFVNTVYGQYVGGPRPFDDLVKNDVAEFLSTIKP